MTALDARAAMAGVEREQLFEQGTAQPVHRGPDRQLHRRQTVGPTGGTQGTHGAGGQAGQLRGELRSEVRQEPPFSASASIAGSASASGDTGRASQIASLSATIRWLSATKRR